MTAKAICLKTLTIVCWFLIGCDSTDDINPIDRNTIICNPTGNLENPWEKLTISESELSDYREKGALAAGSRVPGRSADILINNQCQEVSLSPVSFNDGVFYVHPEDNCGASGLPWSISYNVTGATSHIDGVSNSKTILLDQSGEQQLFAARVCDDLVAYGFDDWYLPSLGELNAMFEQLKLQDIGGFQDAIYWSSTEASPEDTPDYQFDSWTQVFSTGQQKLGFKNISVRCRCIRK